MSDYDRIAKAIHFITAQVKQQPALEEIAAHVHLSPFHFQRLFCKWAGVTPKRYLQVLTLERAKQLLLESRPLLEVSESLGLSSSSRLYDHFVQLEAVTPGEYKSNGAGIQIEYGVHRSPFGDAFVAFTPRGICSLEFIDQYDVPALLGKLEHKWKHASIRKNAAHSSKLIERIFGAAEKADRPLSLHVSGTNFQINVWRALMQIQPGKLNSYSQIAAAIGQPDAARAVGRAVGSNPVAILIPCHRVIQQNGNLGGYHWGLTRKHALHAWESARQDIPQAAPSDDLR